MRNWTLKNWIGSAILFLGIAIIAYLFSKQQLVLGLAFSMIPLLLLVVMISLDNPYWGMIILFTENYFIMGIGRYLPVSGIGVLTDALLFYILFSCVTRTIFNNDIQWKRAVNGATFLFGLWFLYCIFELANPTAMTTAWLASFRSLNLYPFLVCLLASIIFDKFKNLKTIITLLSVFLILAFLKVMMQKSFGFDSAEWRWLHQGDNAKTHLLASGTRYFSFFTDAGNFGSSMAFGFVVFSVLTLNTKDRIKKIYFLAVALLAILAMFISGTRGALAVPAAGFVLLLVLLKQIKIIIPSALVMALVVFLLMFTTIGNGNQQIRRMRTAFDPQEASLMVRKENQKRLSDYMKTRPFGEGIGLSGVDAKRFDPNRLTTNIPNDSSYVKIWVETGVVGLILYLAIHLSIIGYSAYNIMFRIKNQELKGYLMAITCGIFGLLASAYGNAFFTQYPNGMLVPFLYAFIFAGPTFDKELENKFLNS